jgi:hypothetical protein
LEEAAKQKKADKVQEVKQNAKEAARQSTTQLEEKEV